MTPTRPVADSTGGRLEHIRPSFAFMAFVVLSLLAVVPVLILGSLSSNERADQLFQAFDTRAEQQVATVSDMLVQVLYGKAEVLAVTAGTLSAMPDWPKEQLQEIGDAQLLATKSFDAFYVADETARSILFAPSIRRDGSPTRAGVDYSDRAYYREMLRTKATTFSHVQMGRQSHIPNIVIAVPILDDHSTQLDPQLRGYVAAGIHIPIVTNMVRNILHIGDGLRVLVVDAEQKVLVDSASKLKILERVPKNSAWETHCPDARTGYESTDEYGTTFRMACSPMKLGEQTWTIYAGSSRSTVLAGVESARETTRRFAVMALLLTILISAFLAAAIGRQMNRFHVIAQRIALGLRAIDRTEVPWFSPREVFVLRDVVNGTLQQLQQADTDVQTLVEDLRTTNARIEPLATAWEQISDAVEVLDDHGVVQFVNPAWRALLGSEESDPIGQTSTLFSSDQLKEMNIVGTDILHLVQQGHSWTGEVRTRTPGGIRVQGVVVTPVFDEAEQLRVIIVSRRDLTKLRNAEQTVVQNDRLAAIGTLAAGLAHEINNPLTYIQMNLQLIAEAADDVQTLDTREIGGLATDAIDGVARVTRIVQDLLALARKGPDEVTKPMVRLNVTDVVRAAVTLAGPQTNKVTLVELSVPAQLECMGRESELVQVLLNLIINSSQAMSHRPRETNRITITACHDDHLAWIEVKDNGPGIPPQILNRIFEPLFTTKPVGQGTGLGLSVSRSIIEAHGGQLEVASAPDEGCRFMMSIPLHMAPQQPVPARGMRSPTTASATRRPVRSARVLLVDDDPLVARSLGRVLRPLGVVVVDSGPAALDAMEEHVFEVVVSDVRMPEMSGPEFYELAQSIRDTPFVFVTGGTTAEDQAALNRLPWPVLRKPVKGNHLIEVVSSFLLVQEEDTGLAPI